MAIQPYQEDNEVSAPQKRIRWATKRVAGHKGDQKRLSLKGRLHHKRGGSHATNGSAEAKDKEEGAAEGNGSDSEHDHEEQQRRIFFNLPLPPDAKDEDGHPLAHFPRNKIRTAKYTPLSFIPKNLWFQFHNIANIYFLFIIILSIFSIFGASNPGLNAAPLIVIIALTALKDGIEDWRRTMLDQELNNAPVHRLFDYENPNTAGDRVSAWRRMKKATTRAMVTVWGLMKPKKKSKDAGEGKSYIDRAMDESRPSIETRRTSFHSTHSHLEQERIELTPVPSPLPGQSQNPMDSGDRAATLPKGPEGAYNKRVYGTVINPHKEGEGKARFKKDAWKNVLVGDFVRLYGDEEIPADIVVLSTSDADGACYVETKNLDGETNLKVRQALRCSRKVKHARDCEKTEFWIESEPPHANLYNYGAVARWKQADPKDPGAPRTEMAEPVTINNLLLRGCTVRNSEWILGVVVYTGSETKIMLNSGITPSKRAKISKDLNWNVIYNFIILFCMCFVTGTVQGITWAQGNNSLDYFEYGSIGGNPALDGFITFWASVILFQNLVPISLYITVEIIRTLQALFIYNDVHMYYEKLDYPCTPKSWNISDDVGQIEYIFSDKTGTLTQNVMEYKKATINGYQYGEAYTEAQAGMDKRKGVDVEKVAAQAREQIASDRIEMLAGIRRMHDNPYLRDDDLTFVAPNFIEHLSGGPRDGWEEQDVETQKAACWQFMLALALCHTVITERTPGEPPKIDFKAQSPDEAALVATARDVGFTVLGRSDDDIILNILGEEQRFTVLNTLEFNSTRKRMSAIIRMPSGKIILFCKGADSMIYSRLSDECSSAERKMRDATGRDLEAFASEGLRTLCISQREVDEKYYQDWNARHDLAAASVQNRDEKLEECADEIERELHLLGGTAIEDKLQDGVPDAIQLLGRAGIKLWVLTGDKVETAINIGFSCNLLTNEMELLRVEIEDKSPATAERILDEYLAVFGKTGSQEELKAAQKQHEPPEPTHAIVIDGDSLRLVLDEAIKTKFLLLCKECRAVLCCRVSPSQKAAVVGMVKNGLDCLTLSIGDGANDVAMIQEAHVGVGIAGEEGRQAVMSSDYAIGQFRFLTRLVLVHGRWSYRRLAETIANFFYKNLVWTFALFWYQIYDNFDCSYIFDYTYLILYNLAFTSLPVILLGVLDQDVDDMVSLAVPQLYRRGIERLEWTQVKFWSYMVDGIYQSVIVFYMAYLLFSPATFNTQNGKDIGDYKRIGIFIATASVIVANLYVLMNTYRWDWLMLLVVSVSILLVWFWTGVYTATDGSFIWFNAAPEVYGQLCFWCMLLLTTVLCLMPRFAAKAYQKVRMPYDVDVVREQVRRGDFDYLKDNDALLPPPPEEKKLDSLTSSETSNGKTRNGNSGKHLSTTSPDDDMRPMYPPSVAPTATTHNQRSQNGSDGTEYTGHRLSFDARVDPPPNASAQAQNSTPVSPVMERGRPSFDRSRLSIDRVRPSFEASREFSSAALLQRLESSQSGRRLRTTEYVVGPRDFEELEPGTAR